MIYRYHPASGILHINTYYMYIRRHESSNTYVQLKRCVFHPQLCTQRHLMSRLEKPWSSMPTWPCRNRFLRRCAARTCGFQGWALDVRVRCFIFWGIDGNGRLVWFFGILTLAILTGKHCEAAWSMVNSLPLPWNATSQFTTDYVWKAMGKLRKWNDLMIPFGKLT